MIGPKAQGTRQRHLLCALFWFFPSSEQIMGRQAPLSLVILRKKHERMLSCLDANKQSKAKIIMNLQPLVTQSHPLETSFFLF